MPVAIIPDISEQHCIGCALCVEICTALGPDVLRVKPVEGGKEVKPLYFIQKDASLMVHVLVSVQQRQFSG